MYIVNLLLLGLLTQAVPSQRRFGAALVGVEGNVIVIDAVGRVQGHYRIGRQPATVDDFLQQRLAIRQYLLGLHTHHFVGQDGGVRPGQIPGLEKRTPVNVLGQLGEIKVFEHTPTDEFRHGGLVGGPVNRRLVGTRFGQWPQRGLLFVGVLLTHFHVISIQLSDVLGGVVAQQALGHADTARGIRHIDHRTFVVGGNLDCGVDPAAGSAADEQRNVAAAEVRVLLHLTGHVLHLFQARCDQAREANHVGTLGLGLRQNFMARHHHTHIDHVKIIALQDHRNDVFANVVHIPLDRGNDDLAFGFRLAPGFHHR